MVAPVSLSQEHPDLVRRRAAGPARAADAIGVVFDPAIILVLTLVAVGMATSATPLRGLAWAALASVFCAGLPYALLALLLRGGRVSDLQVVAREQRRVPLLAALGFVVGGLALLIALDAPQPVVALVAAVLGALAAMTIISQWSKVSFHEAVVVGCAVVLVRVFGPWALVLAVPAVAAVTWARLRAGRHSGAQLLLGGVVGTLAPGLLFAFLVG